MHSISHDDDDDDDDGLYTQNKMIPSHNESAY